MPKLESELRFDNGTAKGDGNCAFNAFALAFSDSSILGQIEANCEKAGTPIETVFQKLFLTIDKIANAIAKEKEAESSRYNKFKRLPEWNELKEIKTWPDLKVWLQKTRKNPERLQYILAPVLRQLSSDLMSDINGASSEHVYAKYTDAMMVMRGEFDRHHRLYFGGEHKGDIAAPDIYISHEFIRRKFDEICREEEENKKSKASADNDKKIEKAQAANEKNEIKEIPLKKGFTVDDFKKRPIALVGMDNIQKTPAELKLEKWWQSDGYFRFLDEMAIPARGAGDRHRFAGDLELGTLAEIFQLSLIINGRSQNSAHGYISMEMVNAGSKEEKVEEFKSELGTGKFERSRVLVDRGILESKAVFKRPGGDSYKFNELHELDLRKQLDPIPQIKMVKEQLNQMRLGQNPLFQFENLNADTLEQLEIRKIVIKREREKGKYIYILTEHLKKNFNQIEHRLNDYPDKETIIEEWRKNHRNLPEIYLDNTPGSDHWFPKKLQQRSAEALEKYKASKDRELEEYLKQSQANPAKQKAEGSSKSETKETKSETKQPNPNGFSSPIPDPNKSSSSFIGSSISKNKQPDFSSFSSSASHDEKEAKESKTKFGEDKTESPESKSSVKNNTGTGTETKNPNPENKVSVKKPLDAKSAGGSDFNIETKNSPNPQTASVSQPDKKIPQSSSTVAPITSPANENSQPQSASSKPANSTQSINISTKANADKKDDKNTADAKNALSEKSKAEKEAAKKAAKKAAEEAAQLKAANDANGSEYRKLMEKLKAEIQKINKEIQKNNINPNDYSSTLDKQTVVDALNAHIFRKPIPEYVTQNDLLIWFKFMYQFVSHEIFENKNEILEECFERIIIGDKNIKSTVDSLKNANQGFDYLQEILNKEGDFVLPVANIRIGKNNSKNQSILLRNAIYSRIQPSSIQNKPSKTADLTAEAYVSEILTEYLPSKLGRIFDFSVLLENKRLFNKIVALYHLSVKSSEDFIDKICNQITNGPAEIIDKDLFVLFSNLNLLYKKSMVARELLQKNYKEAWKRMSRAEANGFKKTWNKTGSIYQWDEISVNDTSLLELKPESEVFLPLPMESSIEIPQFIALLLREIPNDITQEKFIQFIVSYPEYVDQYKIASNQSFIAKLKPLSETIEKITQLANRWYGEPDPDLAERESKADPRSAFNAHLPEKAYYFLSKVIPELKKHQAQDQKEVNDYKKLIASREKFVEEQKKIIKLFDDHENGKYKSIGLLINQMIFKNKLFLDPNTNAFNDEALQFPDLKEIFTSLDNDKYIDFHKRFNKVPCFQMLYNKNKDEYWLLIDKIWMQYNLTKISDAILTRVTLLDRDSLKTIDTSMHEMFEFNYKHHLAELMKNDKILQKIYQLWNENYNSPAVIVKDIISVINEINDNARTKKIADNSNSVAAFKADPKKDDLDATETLKKHIFNEIKKLHSKAIKNSEEILKNISKALGGVKRIIEVMKSQETKDDLNVKVGELLKYIKAEWPNIKNHEQVAMQLSALLDPLNGPSSEDDVRDAMKKMSIFQNKTSEIEDKLIGCVYQINNKIHSYINEEYRNLFFARGGDTGLDGLTRMRINESKGRDEGYLYPSLLQELERTELKPLFCKLFAAGISSQELISIFKRQLGSDVIVNLSTLQGKMDSADLKILTDILTRHNSSALQTKKKYKELVQKVLGQISNSHVDILGNSFELYSPSILLMLEGSNPLYIDLLVEIAIKGSLDTEEDLTKFIKDVFSSQRINSDLVGDVMYTYGISNANIHDVDYESDKVLAPELKSPYSRPHQDWEESLKERNALLNKPEIPNLFMLKNKIAEINEATSKKLDAVKNIKEAIHLMFKGVAENKGEEPVGVYEPLSRDYANIIDANFSNKDFLRNLITIMEANFNEDGESHVKPNALAKFFLESIRLDTSADVQLFKPYDIKSTAVKAVQKQLSKIKSDMHNLKTNLSSIDIEALADKVLENIANRIFLKFNEKHGDFLKSPADLFQEYTNEQQEKLLLAIKLFIKQNGNDNIEDKLLVYFDLSSDKTAQVYKHDAEVNDTLSAFISDINHKARQILDEKLNEKLEGLMKDIETELSTNKNKSSVFYRDHNKELYQSIKPLLKRMLSSNLTLRLKVSHIPDLLQKALNWDLTVGQILNPLRRKLFDRIFLDKPENEKIVNDLKEVIDATNLKASADYLKAEKLVKSSISNTIKLISTENKAEGNINPYFNVKLLDNIIEELTYLIAVVIPQGDASKVEALLKELLSTEMDGSAISNFLNEKLSAQTYPFQEEMLNKVVAAFSEINSTAKNTMHEALSLAEDITVILGNKSKKPFINALNYFIENLEELETLVAQVNIAFGIKNSDTFANFIFDLLMSEENPWDLLEENGKFLHNANLVNQEVFSGVLQPFMEQLSILQKKVLAFSKQATINIRNISETLVNEVCKIPPELDPYFDLQAKLNDSKSALNKAVMHFIISNQSENENIDYLVPVISKCLQSKQLDDKALGELQQANKNVTLDSAQPLFDEIRSLINVAKSRENNIDRQYADFIDTAVKEMQKQKPNYYGTVLLAQSKVQFYKNIFKSLILASDGRINDLVSFVVGLFKLEYQDTDNITELLESSKLFDSFTANAKQRWVKLLAEKIVHINELAEDYATKKAGEIKGNLEKINEEFKSFKPLYYVKSKDVFEMHINEFLNHNKKFFIVAFENDFNLTSSDFSNELKDLLLKQFNPEIISNNDISKLRNRDKAAEKEQIRNSLTNFKYFKDIILPEGMIEKLTESLEKFINECYAKIEEQLDSLNTTFSDANKVVYEATTAWTKAVSEASDHNVLLVNPIHDWLNEPANHSSASDALKSAHQEILDGINNNSSRKRTYHSYEMYVHREIKEASEAAPIPSTKEAAEAAIVGSASYDYLKPGEVADCTIKSHDGKKGNNGTYRESRIGSLLKVTPGYIPDEATKKPSASNPKPDPLKDMPELAMFQYVNIMLKPFLSSANFKARPLMVRGGDSYEHVMLAKATILLAKAYGISANYERSHTMSDVLLGYTPNNIDLDPVEKYINNGDIKPITVVNIDHDLLSSNDLEGEKRKINAVKPMADFYNQESTVNDILSKIDKTENLIKQANNDKINKDEALENVQSILSNHRP